MSYPSTRLRRLRIKPRIREMIRETRLSLDDLIYPISVDENLRKPEPSETMPGIYRHSIDSAIEEAKKAADLGVPAIYLIAIPKEKDAKGTAATRPDGVMQRTVRGIKRELGDDLIILADSYLGYFMDHSHGGILNEKGNALLDKPTLQVIKEVSVSWAEAGTDIIVCATPVDGRVKAAREALDDNGFDQVALAASVKFHSAFYAPGLTITGTKAKKTSIDQASYYLDFANADMALRTAELDLKQGADIILVKPATPFYDIIYRIKNMFHVPIVAYSISGDYSMIKLSLEKGRFDEKACVIELLMSIKRSGADMVQTYWALRLAKEWLPQK